MAYIYIFLYKKTLDVLKDRAGQLKIDNEDEGKMLKEGLMTYNF